jgi:serine protease AprX
MPDRRNNMSGISTGNSARRPERFDPRKLARSVIAIPLLEKIEAELNITKEYLAQHPELSGSRNAAVVLNESYKEGVTSAYDRVLELQKKAENYVASKARENVAAPKAVSRKKRTKGSVAVAREDEKEAIVPTKPKEEEKDVIDPPKLVQGRQVCVARLDGRIIRIMLAMDRDSDEEAIAQLWPTRHDVIIDINLAFKPKDRVLKMLRAVTGIETDPDVRRVAKKLIERYLETGKNRANVKDRHQQVDQGTTGITEQYVFAELEGKVIRELVTVDELAATAMAHLEVLEGLGNKEDWALDLVSPNPKLDPEVIFADLGPGRGWVESLLSAGVLLKEKLRLDMTKLDLSRLRTIYRVWPDFTINTYQGHSLPTVKADAAQRAFAASGENITWAVIDTGIDGTHPHFRMHQNIDPASSYHKDFTAWQDVALDAAARGEVPPDDVPGTPLSDQRGHGTHVAGIIAGEQQRTADTGQFEMRAVLKELGNDNKDAYKEIALDSISGVAPKCGLVSLKVLDDFGNGKSKHVIAALAHIQRINAHGRELHIHGVNISAGYPFEAEWFACGHSPLCVEVNRLVKSGVVVVVAAGNTGYGTLSTGFNLKPFKACLDLTINDPGNAAEAITVGATHCDQPHRYGVSYFSSKGPTGDGRLKPDLVAPGEKILSCAVPRSKMSETDGNLSECRYLETSGTSQAAPHVSGAIAAFLSIRGEFIGQAERVKQIFMSTATDLGRDRNFQGAGLVDLMRAIQSI